MRRLVNIFILVFAVMGPLEVDAQRPLGSHVSSSGRHLTSTNGTVDENALLGFVITDRNFEAFRQVAIYRHSARLDVLPGFPEDPVLARSVETVRADAGTRVRLRRLHLTARDYVLTGWALVVAHDPEQWGLADERLSPAMRRNIAFVQSRRARVDALLTL